MSVADRPGSAAEIFTPTALNQRVRELLEDALPQIWIEGELSNVAHPASGHLYFTLKDAGAQIRGAMFKPKSTWLKFRPETGMHVLLRARVSLYAPRGDYQLIVDHMQDAGEGALRRAFEELKTKLRAEGLFAEERKRRLPRFPRRIGVITSASGAAIHDVLSVLERRFTMANVEILPVPVQGHEAPSAIHSMLHKASASGRYDVLLLTRGGGSLEDLMAFNDESVARAIHASTVPVVSAIGHEIDFSIADFVADLRAPTPSAAAELLVPDSTELRYKLDQQRTRLRLLLARRTQIAAQQLDQLMTRLQAQRPQHRLRQGSERLQTAHGRLVQCMRGHLHRTSMQLDHVHVRLHANHPRQRLSDWQQKLAGQHRRLRANMGQQLKRKHHDSAAMRRALHAVSPLATLDRGYAILFDENGKTIRSTKGVQPDARLEARLGDGILHLKHITK